MVIKIVRYFALALMLSVLLCGCAPTVQVQSNDQSSFSWTIDVHQVQRKDKLHTDAGTQMYDGTVASTAYDDTPQPGNVFLLVELTVNKQRTGAAPFLWEKLTLQEAEGARYSRLDNDTFLESHGYERLPGTDLMLGAKQGWICFEVLESAAEGTLALIYESDEGNNVIEINLE